MHVTQFENIFLDKKSRGLEKDKFMDNKKQCLSRFSLLQALSKHQLLWLALSTSIVSFELKLRVFSAYMYQLL